MSDGLKPCGTWAAYQRHLKVGDPIDPACAEACRRQAAERYRRAVHEQRVCEQCGAMFTPKRSPSLNLDRVPRFCSRSCRDRARYQRMKEQADGES